MSAVFPRAPVWATGASAWRPVSVPAGRKTPTVPCLPIAYDGYYKLHENYTVSYAVHKVFPLERKLNCKLDAVVMVIAHAAH